MDAVTYLRTKRRMCKTYPECIGCPMALGEVRYSVICSLFDFEFPQKAVEIVEKWSEEHLPE